MSRSKLFNMIKTRGTQVNSRNPFDLSNSHAYSQKAGTITPIKAIHVIPKDYLNIRIRDFTQTLPMMSAPFLKAKKELSAYFVPYNSLWHNFNQYQSTREDPQSSLLQDRGIVYEPRMALYEMYGIPYYAFMYYVFNEFAIIPFLDFGGIAEHRQADLAERIKIAFDNDELAVRTDGSLSFYMPFYDIHATVDNIELYNFVKDIFGGNAYPLPNVLMPFNWYLDSSQSSQVPGLGYFADGRRAYKQVFKDLVGNYNWCDILRKLDMLGYGNIYPYFKAALDDITTAYTNWNASRLEADYQLLIQEIRRSFRGLKIDLATICSSEAIHYESDGTAQDEGVARGENVFVSPLPLFGYNKIFYDYFRNTYYDDEYHVRNYNCDFVFSDSLRGSIVVSHYVPSRFWMLEAHQYKKDMFTAVMPSTQFGSVSVLPLQDDLSIPQRNIATANPNQYTPTSASGSVTANGGTLTVNGVPLYHTHSISIPGSTLTASASLNPLDLKRVEALQQYRQDLLRAGNRTEDIFKQIYGSEPKSQLSEKPYFIDAVSNDLNINPVISTADTQQGVNGSLGDIASRAISSTDGNGLSAKFSTEDFGVVIILSYVIPDSMYNSTMIDSHVTNLSPEEHFIPHFQNLGFEPLYRMFLNNMKTYDVRNNVIGFSLPYLEFKTDVDLAHGAFACSAASHKYDRTIPVSFRGSLSHWVVARTDMQAQDVTELSAFYINPSVLDSVFVQESGADYESDQFICYTQIDCSAVRQITELGLPNFL